MMLKSLSKTIILSSLATFLLITPTLACIDGNCSDSCFVPSTNYTILFFIRILLFAAVLSLVIITAYNIYQQTKYKKNKSKSKIHLTRVKTTMVLFFILFTTLIMSELIARFVYDQYGNKIINSQTNIIPENFVTPSNTWLSAKFPDEYKYPNLTISYPDNWRWSCCNDMDHASVHVIYPQKGKEYAKGDPIIKITDFSLRDCPSNKPECSIDENILFSATNKLEVMKEKFSLQYNFMASSTIGAEKLDANIYETKDKEGVIRLFYLFSTGTDVVSIEFFNTKYYSDMFIDDFLDKLE